MDKKTIAELLTNLTTKKEPVTDSQTHAENKTEKIHCITRAQALSPPSLNAFFLCLFSVIRIDLDSS